MDFYVSWSHSDAVFCDYFKDCPMLVSAVPDNRHSLKKIKTFPDKLIIDSGALFYSKNKSKNLQEIFEIQCHMIKNIPKGTEVKIVHLDEPLFNRKTISEKYEAIERTIYNAMEHMILFSEKSFEQKVSLMGVIQGYDIPSINYSIFELKKLGYTHFGVGSLINKSPKEQMQLIAYASKMVGSENLHVFGVTAIDLIKFMSKLNIRSFDSSRPTIVAAYHQVFYSNPFRTYMIESSNSKRKQQRIRSPLPCNCPICKKNPEDIINISHRKYMKKRSIHNYFHLRKTIDSILKEKEMT